MPEPPRPPYATEQTCTTNQVSSNGEGLPTIADYCAAMDAIDLHIQEANYHLEQAAALLIEAREMLSMMAKTNNANIAAMAKALDGFGISSIPCHICGGEVNEFSIPNDIWNKVIRLDGHEHDQEYLCLNCWYSALRIALGIEENVPSRQYAGKAGLMDSALLMGDLGD